MLKISALIADIDRIVYYIRVQNYHEASLLFRGMLSAIEQVDELKRQLADSESSFRQVFGQLQNALMKNDMILLGDLLEEGLTPVLKSYIMYEESCQHGEYSLEPTSSGFWTLHYDPLDLYLHSNSNPMEEARVWIDKVYNPDYEVYAVWGCGLGYHVRQLYEKARGAIEITVFDVASEIFEIAKQIGVLEGIPADKLHFVVDSEGEEFASYITGDNVGLLLHFPSIQCIKRSELKKSLHHFFSSWNGTIQFAEELAINFRCNKKNCSHNVDEIVENFFGAEVVLVGGGPSLDQHIEYLRNAKDKKIIVAVTTVLKKLIKLGIEPDYTVVMDSQKRTIGQIAGVENYKIPIIIDSTAYWEFGEVYQGSKYIAYQKEYSPAEEAAKRENRKTYETGGSVTTLALDILLQSRVGAVYLVGVDLAYPGGLSHAKDTMDRATRDTSEMEMVPAVNGGLVPTNSLFEGYRKWIERKLKEYSFVKVYNLSTMGAQIEGTILYEEGV